MSSDGSEVRASTAGLFPPAPAAPAASASAAGLSTSTSTTSASTGSPSRAAASSTLAASATVATASVRIRHHAVASSSRVRRCGRWSTTSTRRPASQVRAYSSRAPADVGGLGNEACSVNVLPPPGVGECCRSPPSAWAISRAIARPSPAPPCWRLWEASACVNASNISPTRPGSMPTPVSRTATARQTPSTAWSQHSGSSQTACTNTSPPGVNFTALAMRFTSTCDTRAGSPLSRLGTSGWQETTSSTPEDAACGATISPTRSSTSRGSKSTCSSSRWPLWIVLKSSTSLITRSSDRLATWTPEANRSCSASRAVRSSRSVRPMMPLSGVRSSWLIVARNSIFCRAAAVAASRASTSSRSVRSRAPTSPSWAPMVVALASVAPESSGLADSNTRTPYDRPRRAAGTARMVPSSRQATSRDSWARRASRSCSASGSPAVSTTPPSRADHPVTRSASMCNEASSCTARSAWSNVAASFAAAAARPTSSVRWVSTRSARSASLISLMSW